MRSCATFGRKSEKNDRSGAEWSKTKKSPIAEKPEKQ